MQLSTKGNKTLEVIGFLKGGAAMWRRVAGMAAACVCVQRMEGRRLRPGCYGTVEGRLKQGSI